MKAFPGRLVTGFLAIGLAFGSVSADPAPPGAIPPAAAGGGGGGTGNPSPPIRCRSPLGIKFPISCTMFLGVFRLKLGKRYRLSPV
jgi:hypothetical protein